MGLFFRKQRWDLAKLLGLALSLCGPSAPSFADATPRVNGTCEAEANVRCKNGTILPLWEPVDGLSIGDRAARATVYIVSLVYMFLGVSIIADRFMAAIECITSKEKEVVVKKKSGEQQVVSVRIWNETVSNLTLMALGSSAPEILLSIIEICSNNFNAGDLGPGTIVGSAAFNLFVIIGICVLVIPDGELRRVKHVGVLCITATWSVFAYLWLYIIIAQISPGEVEVWEGIVTFAYFPLTVITAYIADTKIFFKRFLRKKYTVGGVKKHSKDDLEMNANHVDEYGFQNDMNDRDDLKDFEKQRMDYIDVIREIRKKHPNIDTKTLEEMAQMEILNRGPKSRAFYRMQATRTMTGGGNVIKKSKVERRLSIDQKPEEVGDDIQRVFFDPIHYTVMENIGTMAVTVTRTGGDVETSIQVDFNTEDGSAVAGEDYEFTQGTLVFHAGELHKQINVTIIDDDIFEEDEYFYVRLSNAQVTGGNYNQELVIVEPCTATVMVLDDDHAGIFHFEAATMDVSESIGTAEIKCIRASGARGIVRIPYMTIEGTANGGGKDYEDAGGYLEFVNDQTESTIEVRIIDDNDYEKNEFFFIQLGEPILVKNNEQHHLHSLLHRGSCATHTMPPEEAFKIAEINKANELEEMGRPRLGETTKIEVHIIESTEFKNTVDHLLLRGNISLVVGTSSWKEQFIDAITVSAGDGDDGAEGDEDEKLPSCMDYVMHFLTIFWKVLFAFVPPTDFWGGWLCFTVSILVIGALTAVIGELASGFGCTVGLTDAVTAITFVALGTSVPDTFASKVAAVGDDWADSSIGNVTGSNAVNVFLGIGIAWSIAAIYHYANNTKFLVEPGSLGFSVTVFCIFALLAFMVMFLRRRQPIGGELGGPRVAKHLTGCFFVGLWILYVIIAAMENYCHIAGF